MAEQIDIDIVAHDKTSSIISGIFMGIGNAMANFAMQIPGAIMNFGASVLAEANEAEAGLADLRATLESTGGAAGMTEKELLGLADSLSQTTRFSDDAVLAGENMLLTFTNIGEDVFPQATEALLDLATKMKSDLPGAAIQLGKALNDPINGVDALRRVGVQFTDEQKNMIEAMVKTGDIAGAQKIIIAELNKEFGGQAAAAADTFAGRMEILTNRFNNMKEEVGNALIPVLTELIERGIMPLIPYIESAATAFAEWIPSLIPMIRDFALSVYDGFQTYVMPAIRAFSDWWGENGDNILSTAQGIWSTIIEGSIKIYEFLAPVVDDVLKRFGDWWAENGANVIEYVTNLAASFEAALPVVMGFFETISPLLTGFLTIFLEWWEMIFQILTGDWQGAWQSAGEIVDAAYIAIRDSVYNLAGALVEALGFEKNGIAETWSSNWDQMVQIVDKINRIIIQTVQNMVSAVGEMLEGVVTGAVSAASIIGSISTSAAEWGGNLSGGGRAAGGAVSAGTSYLVGEQGAEMFVPNTSGQIIPNGGGSGAINVTLNYAPSVALGNRNEAENTLLPFILSGIRAAQANGLLATV